LNLNSLWFFLINLIITSWNFSDWFIFTSNLLDLVDIQIRWIFISALNIFKKFLISSFNKFILRHTSIIKNIISKIIIIGNSELLLDKGKNIIVIDKITRIENNKLYVTEEINLDKTEKYKEISKDSILGRYVDFRIGKIAYPTIWFKNLIGGDLNE
jgi:hypothetical protein